MATVVARTVAEDLSEERHAAQLMPERHREGEGQVGRGEARHHQCRLVVGDAAAERLGHLRGGGEPL